MNTQKSAVLILFFTRSEPLTEVFEAVRKYKPEKLYLFQDGPRKNRPDDMEKIKKCREIVENINWECDVHRHYCEENLGCDPAEYAAVSWALETEEKIIRLEDDNVASESFFEFCTEMLNKYQDDKRIFMICGRNQLGQTNYKCGSYFFAAVDSIWGFATWRDRWLLLDPKHDFLNDKYIVDNIINASFSKYEINRFLNICKTHREQTLAEGKVASYESAIRAAMLKNNMLAIVPQKNLIRSAGVSDDAVHTPASMEYVMEKDKWLYSTEAYELEFPLQHPQNVLNNVEFCDARNKLLYWDSKSSSIKHKVQLAGHRRWVDLKKAVRRNKNDR